jgi:carboxylesterase
VFRFFGISRVRKPYVSKYRIEAFESTGNYASFPTNGLGQFRDSVKQITKKHLQEVVTPVLIVHSRDDRISHPRSAEFIFDHVGSTYKEMFILKELNHNPLRSENKNKIFERVAHFIET